MIDPLMRLDADFRFPSVAFDASIRRRTVDSWIIWTTPTRLDKQKRTTRINPRTSSGNPRTRLTSATRLFSCSHFQFARWGPHDTFLIASLSSTWLSPGAMVREGRKQLLFFLYLDDLLEFEVARLSSMLWWLTVSHTRLQKLGVFFCWT